MNNRVVIKNFRVFDQDGVMLDIKPITILTGCNSSGKSSVVKGICLLNEFVQNIKTAKKEGRPIDLSQYKLDFKKKPNHLLGSFAKTVNKKSKEKTITFQYRVHSLMLGEDVDVEFVFMDIHNDGYLKSLILRNMDGDMIYSSTDARNSEAIGKTTIHCDAFKTALLRFVEAQVRMNDAINHFRKELQLCSLQNMIEPSESNKKALRRAMHPEVRFDRCINASNIVDDMDEVERSLVEYHKTFIEESTEQTWSDAVTWYIKHDSELQEFYDMPYNKKEQKNPFCGKSDIIGLIEKIKKTGCISMYAQEVVSKEYDYNEAHDWTTNLVKEYHKERTHRVSNKFDTKVVKWLDDADESQIQETNKKLDFLKKAFDDSHNASYLEFIKELDYKIINETLLINQISPCIPTTESIISSFVIKSHQKTDENNLVSAICCLEDLFFYPLLSSNRELKCSIDIMSLYIALAIEEVMSVEMPEPVCYVGSDIANVRRFYPLEENDSITELWKNYLNPWRTFDGIWPFRDAYRVHGVPSGYFVNKWLKEFKICDHFSIDTIADGAGVEVHLYENADDKTGNLLADYGYGITQLFTILLSIGLAKSGQTIAIEEPEIHLHPSFQSKLADMFVEAYAKYNVHFIIETHSEYLIRRLQTIRANNTIGTNDNTILYVYDVREKPGYEPIVKKITIREDGMLNGSFGTGFFDEADNLALSLLTISQNNE